MKAILRLLAWGGLSTLASTHGHAEAADPQEPFVRWTQKDLDAKWGTDVCFNYPDTRTFK